MKAAVLVLLVVIAIWWLSRPAPPKLTNAPGFDATGAQRYFASTQDISNPGVVTVGGGWTQVAPGSSPASTSFDAQVRSAAIYTPPAANGGGTPLADGCRTVFAYNDPSRYVGHQDQRVAAVSTANTVLSDINCGAVGVLETGARKVESWIGGLF